MLTNPQQKNTNYQRLSKRYNKPQIQTKDSIHHLQLQFPEIKLPVRAAKDLRGYFGTMFQDHSTLLHNHFEDGNPIYRYPQVQYKVIKGIPTLIGLQDGARLLMKLFLQIQQLNIQGVIYPVLNKNINSWNTEIGVYNELYEYRFQALWMPLNKDNYQRYRAARNWEEKRGILTEVLTGNIISFFKGVSYTVRADIMLMPNVEQHATHFKGRKMVAFKGGFTTNALLPNYIGLGKAVARGFGTIVRV